MNVLVDANILLYARFSDLPQHQAAREWLDQRLNDPEPTGIPWNSLTAFARIASNPRVFSDPLDSDEIVAQVLQWTSRRNVWQPEPGERFTALFTGLLAATRASGNLVPDCFLAALAQEHGLTMVSSDTDFARFPNLRWLNPLNGMGNKL